METMGNFRNGGSNERERQEQKNIKILSDYWPPVLYMLIGIKSYSFFVSFLTSLALFSNFKIY